jgi:hypothetical protein
MPYRTPDRPVQNPVVMTLDASFWRERNLDMEDRVVQAVDGDIVRRMRKILDRWYQVTRSRYPEDVDIILTDLSQAVIGRGSYVKVSGDPQHVLKALMATAKISGLLNPPQDRLTTYTPREQLVERTRESLDRAVDVEGEIWSLLKSAFANNASKLDSYFVERYADFVENQGQPALLKGVYFRAVAQGDSAHFESFSLALGLYRLAYE